MRIAIPERQGRVSPLFDVARYLWIIDIDNGCETARSTTFLSQTDPLKRARHVQRCGVNVLICGAISWTMLLSLSSSSVEVIPFICGSIEEIISAYCQGRLSDECYHLPGARSRYDVPVSEPSSARQPESWPGLPDRGGRTPKPH